MTLPLPIGFNRQPAKQALISESPYRPSDPRRSADLSILRAWMDADPAPLCRSPRPAADMPDGLERCGQCDACKKHKATVVTTVETAVRQARENASRRLLGWHWREMTPGVRALMAESEGEGLKKLLGTWTRRGFEQGIAGLSEREAQVYWLTLRGWSSAAIACELTAPRRRPDRQLWVKIETVYQERWRAKVKVLKAFGLQVPSDPEEDVI